MLWWAKRIPRSCQNQLSFSDKHVYRRYTFPDFKVFWVNKWTYLPHGCFLRGVFGTASGLGAEISPVSRLCPELMRMDRQCFEILFELARRKAEAGRTEREKKVETTNYHGNPKPSFFGVITHILGV